MTLRELDALTIARLPRWSYIGGSLAIENNVLLDSVLEPCTLFEIGGDLEISRSPSLRRVEGFGLLQWLQGDVRISHHDWDRSATGRSQLTPAREQGAIGAFVVADNRRLEEVIGFESLRVAESHVSIDSNQRLRRITAPAGGVWIGENSNLVELPPLRGRNTLLSVHGNAALSDLSDSKDAQFVIVDLSQNPALISLDGFNLAGGWVDLSVADNEQLGSLRGVGIAAPAPHASLRILSNDSLSDASALEPMTVHPPGQAIIANNPMLPQSQAASLAERLGTIEGKASGNLGWEPPATCPWQDGVCDELPYYGVVLCPVGSDGADCDG